MSHRAPPRPAGYFWDDIPQNKTIFGQIGNCRLCQGIVHKPRRKFCSNDCSSEWKRRQGGMKTVRQICWSKSRGVCEKCGLDCEQLRSKLDEMFLLCVKRKLKEAGLDQDLQFGLVPGPIWKAARHYFEEGYADWLSLTLHAESESSGKFTKHDILSGKRLWQADHDHELIDGGDYYDRRNIVCLCLPCHRAKTSERRKQRHASRQGESDDPVRAEDTR